MHGGFGIYLYEFPHANLFSALNHPLFDNPNGDLTNKTFYGTVSGVDSLPSGAGAPWNLR